MYIVIKTETKSVIHGFNVWEIDLYLNIDFLLVDTEDWTNYGGKSSDPPCGYTALRSTR